MALFKSDDFDKILINVEGDNLEKDALVHQIFGKISKADVPVIRYVALMYDKHSPLRGKITSLGERKKEAAELAGATNKEALYDLSYPRIIEFVHLYIRFQSDKIWAAMTANEEVLWQYQKELLTPITAYKTDKDKLGALEIKTKLMNECDAIIRRIDAYEEKLFGDEKEKRVEVINYTPEIIANIG